jgi:arylsulfatase A
MKRMSIASTVTTVLTVVLFFFSCNTEKHESPENKKPNIILIYMDDMGYGDLECYGHPLIKTPHLNQLASEGIRFTSFYAPAAVCTPSRAGLLTGRYPVRNAPFNFGPESTTGLPVSEITIADVLKEAGYTTAAIGKWHLGHLPEYLPTARGFDSFYGLPYSNDMILPWCPWLTDSDKLMLYEDSTAVTEIGKKQDRLTMDYTSQAISFIKEQADNPFFLYLAHSMPHLPISAAQEFKGTSAAGLYGDVIEMVDWTVGEIIKTLQEANIEEKTLVIFTSDNGPWHNLPERMLQDGIEPWHTGSSGTLRGAKATTYEGGLRVPAIMYWPGQIPANQVSQELATGLDIFPTLVEVSGAQMPVGLKIDGLNLLPLLKGEDASPRKTFIYCKEKTIQAIRKKEWKLRYTEEGMELYNLNEDPSEKYNRAEEFPKMVQTLLEEMQAFAEETDADIYEGEN